MNLIAKPPKEVLPLKAKIFYGLGEGLYTYSIMVFLCYFVFYLTDRVGISAAAAGTIYFIGMIWDAITDPVIGYGSDNLIKWKSGRRRTPLMKIALFPVCLFTVLMFIIVDFGEMGKYLYYTFMVICYYTSTTVFYINYQSLGAEATNDLDQRASLMTYRAGAISIFTAVSTSGTLAFINILNNYFQIDRYSWPLGIAFLCIFALICGALCIKYMKPYETIIDWEKEENNSHESFIEAFISPGLINLLCLQW